jgi:alpha-ketoglutarate-dependent taurine dioxygenase
MVFQPLPGKTFGAVVRELALAKLSSDAFAELYEAWLHHGLLIFPEQHLSRSEQIAFAERVGPLVPGLEAAPISNLRADGTLRDAPDDDMMKIIRGNMEWHQDNTYMPVQAKGAVFSAQIVPRTGGETAFADLEAAWDALNPSLKARCEGLRAYHSLVESQRRLGESTKAKGSEYMGYGLDVAGSPLRPLVKTHPETGRKSLVVGRHAYAVQGVADDDALALLHALLEHVVAAPERVVEHDWQAGDVVLWDNRRLLHRAQPWDFSEPRVMTHSRLAGNPETEGAPLSAP